VFLLGSAASLFVATGWSLAVGLSLLCAAGRCAVCAVGTLLLAAVFSSCPAACWPRGAVAGFSVRVVSGEAVG